jgi:Cys-rich repeat protein
VRRAGLVPIVMLIGACGAQELTFDAPDAAPDAAPSSAGCSSDGDCRLAGLHCDPLSRQCVACVSNDQCTQPGHRVCDSALHLCVECGVNGDCPGGVCEPTRNRCVPSCVDGGLCPYNFLCNQRTGMCVGCTNDADCATARSPGLVCDAVVGQCVECRTDAQCSPARPLCSQTAGRCVECLSNQSCTAGEACDPAAHVCVDSTRGAPSEGGAYPLRDGSADAPYR